MPTFLPAALRFRLEGPLATSMHITMVSSSALSNLSTTLISLLVTPLFQVLLMVALLASIGVSDIRDAAYASITLTFGMGVLQSVVGQAVRDREIGVMHDVLGHGIWNGTYWGGKLLVAVLMRIVPAILGIIAVFLLDGMDDAAAFWRVLALLPLAAVTGALVGITASIASMALSNPYLISNVLGSVLIITAGVVLPLSLYPVWLAAIAQFLPFTAVIEAIRGYGPVWPFVLRELLVSLVWLSVGVLISQWVMTQIRSGRRAQEIW